MAGSPYWLLPSPDLVDGLEEEAIVFQINTLPVRGCLLLDDLDGLRDGRVFAAMLHAAGTQHRDAHAADGLDPA